MEYEYPSCAGYVSYNLKQDRSLLCMDLRGPWRTQSADGGGGERPHEMGEHRVVTEHQEGEDPIVGEEPLSWGFPLDSHCIFIVKEKHTVWITASGVKASCLGKANENMHISCLALSVFMVFSSKSLPCFVRRCDSSWAAQDDGSK